MEELAQKKTELIFCDWMMPEMDGLQLCQNIRELQSEHYIYFILISDKNSKQDIKRGLKGGVDDYISKPIDFDELETRIGIGAGIIRLNQDLNNQIKRVEKNYFQIIQMINLRELPKNNLRVLLTLLRFRRDGFETRLYS